MEHPPVLKNVCEDENNVTKPYVLHAEANATAVCGSLPSNSSKGATIYVTSSCIECAKLIIQSDQASGLFLRIIEQQTAELLKRAGIIVDYIDLNE